MKNYLEVAAQCWCDPRTEKIEMIPELAKVISEKLIEARNDGIREASVRGRIAQLEDELVDIEILKLIPGSEVKP